MAIPNGDKRKEYEGYAEHCLKMAKIAPDQISRMIQREMAAEWLKLAEQAETKDTVAGVKAARHINGHVRSA